jgi:hypothetical protein
MKYCDSIKRIILNKYPETETELKNLILAYFQTLDEYKEFELNTKGEMINIDKVRLPSFKELKTFLGYKDGVMRKLNEDAKNGDIKARVLLDILADTEEFIHGVLESGLVNKDRYCRGVEVMLKSKYKDMYSSDVSDEGNKTIVNVVFKNEEVKNNFDKLSEI